MRECKDYPEQFAAATQRAVRTLEDEAVRRAHEGLRKAVYYKGKIVGWETEYSDSLMLALLKANAPEKYAERKQVSGPDGGPIKHDHTLDVASALSAHLQSLRAFARRSNQEPGALVPGDAG